MAVHMRYQELLYISFPFFAANFLISRTLENASNNENFLCFWLESIAVFFYSGGTGIAPTDKYVNGSR